MESCSVQLKLQIGIFNTPFYDFNFPLRLLSLPSFASFAFFAAKPQPEIINPN